jgi:hypothetical protein
MWSFHLSATRLVLATGLENDSFLLVSKDGSESSALN